MTLKEATSMMLKRICVSYYEDNGWNNVPDKEIAKHLGLTAAAFSRLKTGVTAPKATTWLVITEAFKQRCGELAAKTIIEQIE